jgi:hypothetical protein
VLPGSAGAGNAACPEDGVTVAASADSRLYTAGDALHGCSDDAGRAFVLHGIAAEVTFPAVEGRFAAFSVPGGVQIWDLQTGTSATFAPQGGVHGLLLSRSGRAGWIVEADGGYEVHRGDVAQRDRLLDSGAGIRPASLAVRKGKLIWRKARNTRSADFDGMRGDKPPLDEQGLIVVPGTSEVQGPGPIVWRFAVEVERGLPIDQRSFASAIEDILFDDRGWLGPGARISLQRVDEPPFDFRVTLAKPRTTDRLCLPLHTGSRVSCENRGRSVLNWLRWSTGSPYWGSRSRYRNYLVNHEVGHSLGHGHRFCAGAGQVAPIMQQQTGPAAPCIHAQWPKRFERRRSGRP